MGCMRTLVIILSVAIIGLSIYLYTPLPEDVPDPWKVRSVLACSKMIGLMCKLGSVTGYDSCLNITRAAVRLLTSPTSKSDPLLKVIDTAFDGIKVRIYRPKNGATPSPALMYFHGGGWSQGSIDVTDAFTAEIAKSANIVVVSVDYRLAPEYPFPIPFEDCVTATLHLLQNYERYGVDATKIAVGGDSSGGNLAAATALLLNSNPHTPNITLQVLVYPPTQAFSMRLPSYLASSNQILLTSGGMAQFWLNYIGKTTHLDAVRVMLADNHTSSYMKKSQYGEIVNASRHLSEKYAKAEVMDVNSGNDTLWKEMESKVLNPYFSPLMAHEFSNFPLSIVVTVKYDVLLDDSLLMLERLRSNGIEVVHRHYPLIHGLLHEVYMEASLKATQEIAKDIQEHFVDENEKDDTD